MRNKIIAILLTGFASLTLASYANACNCGCNHAHQTACKQHGSTCKNQACKADCGCAKKAS